MDSGKNLRHELDFFGNSLQFTAGEVQLALYELEDFVAGWGLTSGISCMINIFFCSTTFNETVFTNCLHRYNHYETNTPLTENPKFSADCGTGIIFVHSFHPPQNHSPHP